MFKHIPQDQPLPTPALAQEIYRCYDEFGVIRVLEDNCFRYLAFGDGGEQSCIRIDTPTGLVHNYIKVMLMGMCFLPQAAHCTVIGVGAGSLVTGLQQFNNALLIQAVELRAEVLCVAKKWFKFNPSEQVSVVICDAFGYLCSSPAMTDVLFIDIYNDDGIDDGVSDYEFVADCYDALNEGGLLVMNLWKESGGIHRRVLKNIRRYFSQNVKTVTLDDGNIIVFAKKSGAKMHCLKGVEKLERLSLISTFSPADFESALQDYR